MLPTGNTVSAQSPHTAALCVFAGREPRTFGFICFRVGVSLRFPPFCDCYLKLHFGRRPWRAPPRHPLMQPQTNLLTAIQRCPSGHFCVLPAGHWPRHLRACLSQASWLTAGLTFPGRYIGCYAAVFLRPVGGTAVCIISCRAALASVPRRVCGLKASDDLLAHNPGPRWSRRLTIMW